MFVKMSTEAQKRATKAWRERNREIYLAKAREYNNNRYRTCPEYKERVCQLKPDKLEQHILRSIRTLFRE
jgi:hypothetical protein